MSQRSLAALVGTPFALEFSASAGAGYAWHLESPPPGIELLSREVRPPVRAGSGDHAREVFQLHATRAGAFELLFALKRSWEPAAVRTEIVRVLVSEGTPEA